MRRYQHEGNGQLVEMALVPGLSFSSDQWHRRAATPRGFKKAQILAQEWTLAQPRVTPRAQTAGSPRIAKLVGASAQLDPRLMDGQLVMASRPSTSQPSRATFRGYKHLKAAHETDGRLVSEAASAYTPKVAERPGVLRFSAYLTECIDWQSSGELGQPEDKGKQIRKFAVHFYLEDGTVEVIEERVLNSGLHGGTFFSRAPPPASVGASWQPRPPNEQRRQTCSCGPEELLVGGELEFLGQTFRLVDADGFTRAYYQSVLGITQPAAVGYPEGCPIEYRAEHATRLGKSMRKVAYGKFGGPEVHRKSTEASAHHAQMAKERQFYSNNDEVLAFVVAWRDDTPGGEVHEFTLNFYLSTMCVDLHAAPRQGFDCFIHLLANRLMPVNWEEAQKFGQPLRYAEPADFIVGSELRVYNRVLKILDCSEFTRRWYELNLGILQPPSLATKRSVDIAEEALFEAGAAGGSPRSYSPRPRQLKKPLTPAEHLATDAAAITEAEKLAAKNPFCAKDKPRMSFTGRQLCLERKTRLIDKVVRCRLRQIISDDTRRNCPGIARALDALPRTFILSYFLSDDELAIYEEHVNNSGIMGGAFLKKGKYTVFALSSEDSDRNMKRLVAPSDLHLGAVLKFSANNSLEIVEIDQASLKTMAEFPDLFPFSDPAALLGKLAAANPNHDAIQADLDQALAAAGLNAHERLTLASKYSAETLCGEIAARRELPDVAD